MTEREEVVKSLEALDLDACEDSHERLSAICKTVNDSAFGWTLGACDVLRERLVRLIGGDGDGCSCEGNGDGVRAAAGRADDDGQPSRIALMAEYHRGFVDGCNLRETATWQLDQERLVAVGRLRGIDVEAGGFVKALAEAVGVEWQAPRVKQTIAEVRDRLIHLLGGNAKAPYLPKSENMANKDDDCMSKIAKTGEIGKLGVDGTSPNDDGTCPNDGPTPSITDELRKWVKSLYTPNSDELKTEGHRIADRIDGTFARICEQQEAVLQSTIERMADENLEAKDERDHWKREAAELQAECDRLTNERDKLDKYKSLYECYRDSYAQCIADYNNMRMERDELQRKLDEYEETHIELPKDANGEQVSIGDTVHDSEEGYDFRVDGFQLWGNTTEWWAFQDQAVQQKLERCSIVKPSTVEQVIHDLTLGKITESQAIERIEGING